MRWLDGRRVRLEGDSPAIRDALAAHGATLVDAVDDADALIQVAAAAPARPAHMIAHDEWRIALDRGLDGRFRLAQAFAAARRRGNAAGVILFVGAPEQAAGSDQAAAAGALGNLVKTLGVEWARDGIRVNAVQTVDDGATLGTLAAYLISDYAAYVTGAVTGIDLADR